MDDCVASLANVWFISAVEVVAVLGGSVGRSSTVLQLVKNNTKLKTANTLPMNTKAGFMFCLFRLSCA